jgi:uroporphyrinogen decarboxylase
MRQAGRHLATYRAMREKYSFLEMCHTPELIAEVSLLPIDAYGMDAAILFSDILVIPEAMGVGLRFEENVGPLIDRPLSTIKDVHALPNASEIFRLNYVAEGIHSLKPQLKVPLIGFCGAPFTVASYMIEGKTSRDLKKTKQWMFRDPEGFHLLLQKITDWSIQYLLMQIKAGVQAVQLFESWANALSYGDFFEFSLIYLKQIVDAIRSTNIPVILFGKGSSVFASVMEKIAPAGISLDWNCSLPQMRKQISKTIALQGNLDPQLLYASPQKIVKEVNHLLDQMEGEPGFIFNLGHGLPPDVSEEAVRTLVETVQMREQCPVQSPF